MCGIFGLLLNNNSTNESLKTESDWQGLLQSVNEVQKHRGPDEQSLIYDVQQGWGFAHQRLALLDLSSAGRQPMLSHSKDSLLVYNGEIYNYKNLRNQLNIKSTRGHSDTEILLEGLESKSDNLLTDLDGMFAFGHFNKISKRLLLAVDPAGEKPIYTYWDGRVFAFASEIKTLLSLKFIRKDLSKDCIKSYLVYGYVPYPNTIYKYIRKLPAGSFQWFDSHTGPSKVRSYWNLLDYCTEKSIKYSAAKEEVQFLLKNAVSKRLVADVPVGSFLSGGLDSSVISYLAAQANPEKRIETFSISFNSKDIPKHYDESQYANHVAQLIHSKHHEIHLDFDNLNSSRIINQFGEPFADSSAIPTFYLCQETSRNMKAVLSGDGGDELFGGYLRFRAGLISNDLGPFLNPILALVSFKNAPYRSRKGFLMRFKSRLMYSTLTQQAAWNSYFDQKDFEIFLNESAENLYNKVFLFESETNGLSSGQKILYYNFKTYLFDDLLPKVDRMSMSHGLEVRAPFLDKALIEFVFSVPTKYKFTYFESKRILKDIYTSVFGSDFVNRKKMGFALPIEKFVQSQDMKSCLQELKDLNLPSSWHNLNQFNSNLPNYYQKSYLLISLRNQLSHKS